MKPEPFEEKSPETGGAVQSIDAILSDSARKIEGEKPIPIKRPRGRPRKDAQAMPAAAPAQAPDSQPVDLTPFLGHIVGLPFDLMATKTGFPGFRLEDAERAGLAPMLDQVLKQYCPDIGNSPHAAAFALAGSIGMLAYGKYMVYADFLKKEAEKKPEKPAQSGFQAPVGQPIVFPTITA